MRMIKGFAVLIALALQIFTYGVSSSLRSTDTKYFFYVCLVAALIGLGLGKGKSKPIQTSVAVVAMGLIGIWILGARLVNPLTVLMQSIVALIPQIIPAIQSKISIDTSAITDAWGTVMAALSFGSSAMTCSPTPTSSPSRPIPTPPMGGPSEPTKKPAFAGSAPK